MAGLIESNFDHPPKDGLAVAQEFVLGLNAEPVETLNPKPRNFQLEALSP